VLYRVATLLIASQFLAAMPAKSEILGTDLYRYCEAQKGSHEQDVCIAFILGVLKGIDYGGTVRSVLRKPCFAQYVSPEQAELIVKKYMRDHPEQLGFDAGMVASVALLNAFGGCQPADK
jgi:Rap1a immunity proteins